MVVAVVGVLCGGSERDAAEDLGLETGKPATVLIKSTEVMIGVD